MCNYIDNARPLKLPDTIFKHENAAIIAGELSNVQTPEQVTTTGATVFVSRLQGNES